MQLHRRWMALAVSAALDFLVLQVVEDGQRPLPSLPGLGRLAVGVPVYRRGESAPPLH
jgi:hypothetical protein